MAVENIDFEGGDFENANNANNTNEQKNNIDGNPANKEDSTDLSNNPDTVDVNDNHEEHEEHEEKKEENKTEIPHDLEVGTTIEIDGESYTINEKGDIVDKDGKVFKEAKDVKEFIEANEVSDDTDNEITIDNIKKQLGTEITDENGNPVEFANTPEGVKSYVESVINLRTDEIRQGTINKLYEDNPIVKQFIDYLELTGTYEGFGELPDRRGIEIDKDNKEQQIAIIKMAAREFGNSSLNDNYIKYLDSVGALYDEAKAQLTALQDKDEKARKSMAEQADAAREQERQEVENYFKKVNQVITSRKLGDYTLPENIVKERNGQKVTLTLDDFYNYVAKAIRVDDKGTIMTQYQRDLNNQSDDELLNKELVDAWLMFTGGSYKDLISMLAKEDTVRKVVTKSRENRNRHQVTIKKPTKSKGNIDDIIF